MAASPNGSGKHGTHGIHNDLFLVQGLRCIGRNESPSRDSGIEDPVVVSLSRDAHSSVFSVINVSRHRTLCTLITHPLKSERAK